MADNWLRRLAIQYSLWKAGRLIHRARARLKKADIDQQEAAAWNDNARRLLREIEGGETP